MENSYQNKKILISLILAVLLCCTLLFPIQSSGVAFASEATISNVLTDLKKSPDFNVEDYPLIENDYSLKVIQIAESSDNDLLIYVYQPTGEKVNLRATTISMSTKTGEEFQPILYELEYQHSNGVFYKYRVKDFTIPSKDTRIYNIISIMRPFIKGIDKDAGYDNTISEVPFKVAKEYTFHTGSDSYQMEVLDVVEITSKFVGYVRYFSGGNPFLNTSTDSNSHFVAFSTDKKIDDLLDIDLYYESQSYEITQTRISEGNYQRATKFTSDVKQNYVRYFSGEKMEFKSNGLFGTNVVRDRIQTVTEFIQSETMSNVYTGAISNVTVGTYLNDTTTQALKDKQWVVRFADYESKTNNFMSGGVLTNSVTDSTCVTNVSILRLKFVTDGQIYNLGVVDNKQTGSNKPSNQPYFDMDFKLPDLGDGFDWKEILALIMLCVLGIALLVVLAPVLPYIVQGLFTVFAWIGRVLGRSARATANSVRNVAISTKKMHQKAKERSKREEKQYQKKLKKELRKKHGKKE